MIRILPAIRSRRFTQADGHASRRHDGRVGQGLAPRQAQATKIQYMSVQVLAQRSNDLHYGNSRDRALAIAMAIDQNMLGTGDPLGRAQDP
jgi:5-methyltetrahydropteroyltriglutamate--homocysteine methyltransferase